MKGSEAKILGKSMIRGELELVAEKTWASEVTKEASEEEGGDVA